jgi:hypothetical protein
MNIPLDNLYHWIHGLCPVPAVLYLFYPHGSKNISDLRPLTKFDKTLFTTGVQIIAHDQEPLNFNFYKNIDPLELFDSPAVPYFLNQRCRYVVDKNLMAPVILSGSLNDQAILLHSEKNSNDLEQYSQANFVPVYYWCHAVIARDWYRFAKIDSRLIPQSPVQKKFLIYCRSWGGSREYRLKFMELLIEQKLHEQSQTSLSKQSEGDAGSYYQDHKFKNINFRLDNPVVLDLLEDNHHASIESARYVPDDFNSTGISVVLETMFDDSRIHLTEKTLRPIACGHPFLLAAGAGSLEYLRSYGFKTFAPWIDETYDQEPNSRLRLEKIVNSMKKINSLPAEEFEQFLSEVRQIAAFNKTHFFSDAFQQCITTELQDNLTQGINSLKKPRGSNWRTLRRLLRRDSKEYLAYSKQPGPYSRTLEKFRWLRSQNK